MPPTFPLRIEEVAYYGALLFDGWLSVQPSIVALRCLKVELVVSLEALASVYLTDTDQCSLLWIQVDPRPGILRTVTATGCHLGPADKWKTDWRKPPSRMGAIVLTVT